MIVVRYNNIILYNVTTRAFRQEVVYDPSGTDQLYNKYTLQFEGLITRSAKIKYATCTVKGPNLPFHPQHELTELRQALSDPRHTLEVFRLALSPNGGNEWVTVFRCVPAILFPNDPDRDPTNGPKPISLEVIGTLGGHSVKVLWTVECTKLDLPPTDAAEIIAHTDNPEAVGLWTVLDNRWTVEEEMDSNFYITRTIRGTLKLAKPISQIGWDYRWITVPALEAGFKRESFRYAVREDGLTCDYECVDRQCHTSAPWPATDMRVTHTKSTEMGTTYVGSVVIELDGPPHIPRKALVARGVQILDALTQYVSRNLGGQGQNDPVGQTVLDVVPVHLAITELIGQQSGIRIEFQYRFTPHRENWGAGGDLFIENFRDIGNDLVVNVAGTNWDMGLQHLVGDPDYHNPNLSWFPFPYGYTPWGTLRDPAAVMLFQCYLQKPYLPWHATGWLLAPNQENPQDTQRPAVQEVQVQRVDALGEVPGPQVQRFSDEHKRMAYTYCRMLTKYKIKKGLLQFELLNYDYVSEEQRPPKHNAIIEATGGSVKRVIIVDAERAGSYPQIPAAVDFYKDPNGVIGYLDKFDVELLPPIPNPSADTMIYRLRAKYVYLLDRMPPFDKNPWPVGHSPYVADQSPGWLPSESFNSNLGPAT